MLRILVIKQSRVTKWPPSIFWNVYCHSHLAYLACFECVMLRTPFSTACWVLSAIYLYTTKWEGRKTHHLEWQNFYRDILTCAQPIMYCSCGVLVLKRNNHISVCSQREVAVESHPMWPYDSSFRNECFFMLRLCLRLTRDSNLTLGIPNLAYSSSIPKPIRWLACGMDME